MATREKSNLYPNANWNDCFEFAKTISSFNLKAVSYAEVAKKYGISNLGTKSFTSKISSSKQFGLITTSSGSIQITELAKKLLFPTGDIEKLKMESFRLPPLYDKLIKEYDGKALPKQELFENILMSEHKIAKNVKAHAARCFFESANQLELIKGGILYYSDSLGDVSNDETTAEKENKKVTYEGEFLNDSVKSNSTILSEHKNITNNSLVNVNDLPDYITQNIPVSSGKIAQIVIPIDADEDDLLLIKDMFDILLKRKFKIDI